MNYRHVVPAEFVERPNRFIAYVNIAGSHEKVHVRNTGRCKELLRTGVKVYLEKSDNPSRSTAYDLIAVEKNGRMVNIDSQAPNKVVKEWLEKKTLFPDLVCIRPETTYGKSRFDFFVETAQEKIFIEVKGVTLEADGEVRFPDAPSERAVKHVEELIRAKKAGYRVFIIFIIQMEQVTHFLPNRDTHAAFADALAKARDAGVEILAYDCKVTADSMEINAPVPVYMSESELKQILRNRRLFLISKPLLKWYDENRRILPWREEPSPYRVWISEIMLQQTRVEAVKPYFERFMKALPDIKSLAEAEEEVLLKLWEGLGYYNRVRNLQKAAIQIMEQFGGEMPHSYEELHTLKGIGSYTAGAIASIAFGRKVPAVDGNVLRVLSRIRMDERCISDAKVKQAVEREIVEAMPKDRPGDFNQAMMEIGACVCIPNGLPHCDVCPLNAMCLAHEMGKEKEFPKKEASGKRKIEKKTVLVIRDAETTVLRKRGSKGLLAGMYEFPTLEGFCTAEEVYRYLTDMGMKMLRIQPLRESVHVFTHKEWHMHGFMIQVDELAEDNGTREAGGWLYIHPEETKEKYPIPKAYAAYTEYLKIKLGNERYQEE